MALWIGLFSVLLALISYSIYFRDIFRGKTKPHALTWLIWAVLNGCIFVQQFTHDGGPGAWVTGVAAFANIIIFGLSFKYGERNITRLDWLCLAVAMIVMGLWLQRVSDELTVILACAIFIVGFIPTLRKSYGKPREETIVTFGLNSVKFFLALLALHSLTLITALYPVVLGIVNGYFVIFLIVRGKIKHNKKRRTYHVHAHSPR